MKNQISKWLDCVLKNGVPKDVTALCFNIYEDVNNNWSLELVGTNTFDTNNTDWTCEEVTDFGTRSNPFTWNEKAEWYVVSNEISEELKAYLNNGRYAKVLKSKEGIAVGFVDGDIEMLYVKKARKQMRRNSVIILINIIAIALLLAFYLIDVFIFKTPPTKNLFKFILVSCTLTISFNRLAARQKTGYLSMEKAYAEQIGTAFENDTKSRKNLLSALSDYNKDEIGGCLKKLKKLYDKAKDKQDRQVIHIFTALCLEEIGKKADAIDVYNCILEENPTHSTALSNLSILYNDTGDFEKAIACAKRAIACDYKNPFAYNNLASAYFKSGELEKAKENALIALELKKGFRQPAALLAIIHSLQNNQEEADRYTKIAVAAGQKAEDILITVKNYQERYQAIAEFNAKVMEWERLTGKPSIHFTLQGKGGKSIVGGQVNEHPPLSSKGEKMRLLAAIFCSELPENDILPKQGVLRFYITPNDYYGANFDDLDALNKQNYFRVLFDEKEDGFETYAYAEEDEYFPVFGSYRLSFLPQTDGMSLGDYRYNETYDKLLGEGANIKFSEEDMDEFIECICAEEHKIGGYPCFAQYDPRDNDDNYGNYDTLLFQLVSEYDSESERIMFGDAGICNFFIPHEKLKNCDFSDILYTWDCG